MNVLDSVSVRVKLVKYEDSSGEDPYNAFTYVEANVFIQGTAKAIGKIHAVLVNRQRIPDNCFWETFDDHSATMEWVGTSLMENRYGRTNLESLRECDDPEFYFMLISSFHVYHDSSDVAAAALHKFLHDSTIKGNLNYGCGVFLLLPLC